MGKTEIPLGFGGITAPLGSHIAVFYRDAEERRGVLIPFVKTGLENGARCFVVLHEDTREGLQKALPEVDLEAAEASGRLQLFAAAEVYLSRGRFSPRKPLGFYEALLRAAVAEGCGEIRVIADMSWALPERPGVSRLMEYEAKAQKMLSRYPQLTICLYDMKRVQGDIILDALRTHPCCILGGILIRNHFYMHPDEFLRRIRSSDKDGQARP